MQLGVHVNLALTCILGTNAHPVIAPQQQMGHSFEKKISPIAIVA